VRSIYSMLKMAKSVSCNYWIKILLQRETVHQLPLLVVYTLLYIRLDEYMILHDAADATADRAAAVIIPVLFVVACIFLW